MEIIVKKPALVAISVGFVALLATGLWDRSPREVPEAPLAPVASQSEPNPAVTDRAAQAAPESGLRLPIASPAPTRAAQADPLRLDPATLMSNLFGHTAAMMLFQWDDFSRRVVSTVDNLGRPTAPARLWPMVPAAGRFMTRRIGQEDVINVDNGRRYALYVHLIEKVDLARLVKIYTALYPDLQKAYEELGYPRRYFNDRLIEVLDQLAATPVTDAPIKVRQPAIYAPIQPTRTGPIWEFSDPDLRSLTSGQKILLRMGPSNGRRVKARLTEMRRLLVVPQAKP